MDEMRDPIEMSGYEVFPLIEEPYDPSEHGLIPVQPETSPAEPELPDAGLVSDADQASTATSQD